MDPDFDLADDLDDLRGLRAEPESATSEFPDELAASWRALYGIPEFGYRVVKGYGIQDMELWRVRFIAKSARPSWGRPSRTSKCWVTYEYTECLWKGPKAKGEVTHTMKDGRVVSRFCGMIESFELSLNDAVCKMRQYRDEHRRTVMGSLVQLRENLRSIQESIEYCHENLRKLDAFRAEDVVPRDLLEAEDMEIERVLNELRDA